MNRDELVEEIGKKLKTLRACDTQASAVEWMKGAYSLMEACLEELKDRPATVVRERLVFVPEKPKLVIAHSIPKGKVPHYVDSRPENKTVVYPEVFLPPGLKPIPKAWTRADTLRLEAAMKEKRPAIQRRGR
jgi:hypothetical protein